MNLLEEHSLGLTIRLIHNQPDFIYLLYAPSETI